MASNKIDLLKTLLQDQETERVIQLICQQPELLEGKDTTGMNGFLHIAYSGNQEAFNQAVGLKKSYSFHEAIISGKSDQVMMQVEKNHDLINTFSPDGFTPVALAAFFNQPGLALYLLDKGANPNTASQNPAKVNALHAAVAKGNYLLCERMIAFGVDINQAQVQNVTPLHSAAHQGDLELVKLLVVNGAQIEAKMENGDTPIALAEKDGHKKVLNYLRMKLKESGK